MNKPDVANKPDVVYYSTSARFARALFECRILWEHDRSTAICFGRVCILPDRFEVARLMLL